MVEQVVEYRAELIEMAVEQDDEVMEKLPRRRGAAIDTLIKCIRKGTIDLAFFPTSAARRSRTRACSSCWTPWSTTCRIRRKCRRSPRSTSRAPTTGNRDRRSDAPVRALAFKIMDDRFGA